MSKNYKRDYRRENSIKEFVKSCDGLYRGSGKEIFKMSEITNLSYTSGQLGGTEYYVCLGRNSIRVSYNIFCEALEYYSGSKMKKTDKQFTKLTKEKDDG